MKGFFDKEEVDKMERGDETTASKRVYSCEACGLYKVCKTPKIKPVGNGKMRILLIGDMATSEEDRTGNQLHGARFNFLRDALKKAGIDITEDCWYTHATRCYSPRLGSKSNPLKAPTLSACHGLLMAEIVTLKPYVIVPLTQMAWDQLFYDRESGRDNTLHHEWAGMIIPDQKLMTWVAPIYDPIKVKEEWDNDGRTRTYNKYELFFNRQIRALATHCDDAKPVPVYRGEQMCRATVHEDQAIAWIEEARTWRESVSLDYETTGLKPHRIGQIITTASLSNGVISYGFKFHYTPRFLDAWKKFCLGPQPKISHNMGFEWLWTMIQCGHEVKNIQDDTLLLWHVLHNNRAAGLKFLVYALYGIMGYDALVDQFIKSTGEEAKKYGGNGFNRMREAPQLRSATYCAEDSLYTAWLRRDLLPLLHPDRQLPGYKILMDGQRAFDKMTLNGMVLDQDKLAELKETITKKVAEAAMVIDQYQFIIHNWNGDAKFNPGSDYDVRRLLYSLLKLPVPYLTEGGEPSVDEEALNENADKMPLVRDILTFRKWGKILNTYIGQFEREAVDGVIHGFFKLHGVATYRSSSSMPNMQNLSKRNKEAKEAVRSMLRPFPGHKLIEYDYKSAEVAIAAAVSGDRNLIRYVSDPSTDMHLDSGMDLFMLPRGDVNKNLRNVAKGPFVFASFYGSYWKQTALGIWKEINVQSAEKQFGLNVVEHLRSKGIKNYELWEKHVEKQEHILWNDRFPEYQKFREDTFDFFKKYGYIPYVNGFTYEGPASKNEVLNAPVQGPAFHVQLWSLARVTDAIEAKKMEARGINDVHDSMVFSVPPYEEEYLDNLVWTYGTQKVKEVFPWITVPLMIEKESSEVNGTWAAMKNNGYVGVGQ